jgi:hypothetical protein
MSMNERKALAAEDVATGLQMTSMVMQAAAQLEAAQQAMALWQDNLHYRYCAPAGDGWRLERWTDGFVKETNDGAEDDQ